MSTARFTVLALVAACSSKKSAPPPAAPCLPGEISSTGTGIAAVDGITAHACWGDRCLTLDREGTATGPADHDATEAARRAAESSMFAQVTTSATAVKACANGGTGKCVEIPLPGSWTFASPSSPAIAASASLKRLSALLVDRIETWDLKTKQLLASFPSRAIATEAHYIGDGRLVARGSADSGWLLRDVLSGETIGVGAPGWNLAVIDAKSAVVFHDAKLSVVNAAGMSMGPSFTLPGRVAMATAWFDRILVVLDHPAGTAQIDPGTGTLYSGPALPICK
jgi:hypothetical protein